MTNMKEFYEKIKAEDEKHQKPDAPQEGINQLQHFNEQEKRLIAGFCINCGSTETMVLRKIQKEGAIEYLHCHVCGQNWKILVDFETNSIRCRIIEINWIDLLTQQNND